MLYALPRFQSFRPSQGLIRDLGEQQATQLHMSDRDQWKTRFVGRYGKVQEIITLKHDSKVPAAKFQPSMMLEKIGVGRPGLSVGWHVTGSQEIFITLVVGVLLLIPLLILCAIQGV